MADKHVPEAEIRRVWLDKSITSKQAADAVGLSRSQLWFRASRLGLGPRTTGRRPKTDSDLFKTLWEAGVFSKDIAKVFKCDWQTVGFTARRHNLAPREPGHRWRAITLEQYKEILRAAAAQKRMKL